MSNRNTIFFTQSRIINNLKNLQSNNFSLKNNFNTFKNNKKKKINEYLDNKFNEYKENRIKKLKSCSNDILKNDKKTTIHNKIINDNNTKTNASNENNFINEKNMKCKLLKNNSVNLDDYTFNNINCDNYESPKFSSNNQSQLNLISKCENKNRNKKKLSIDNDLIHNNNNKNDIIEQLNSQFIIGENNINLISKENIQFKENIFKRNQLNNLYEIPENKNLKTNLKLNQKKLKNEISNSHQNFIELLHNIRNYKNIHKKKTIKSNEKNNIYTMSFQNNEMNDINNLNKYLKKKVPQYFYNSTYFKYISNFKNINSKLNKIFDKNNLILTNDSSYIKKFSCIMPSNPYESVLEARENSFFNI